MICGVGHIGRRHAALVSRHPQARLVALVDSRAELGPELAAEFPGVPFFASLAEFLAAGLAADVLTIATPNHEHAPQAIWGLRAGLHVVIEKPIALRKTDAEAIVHTALQTGRLVFGVMQNRYSPPAAWLKQVYDEGRLGQVYLVQLNCFWNRDARYYRPGGWRGTQAQDGGTLFTQFSHFVDLLYWVFGDITNIAARFRDFNHQQLTEFEDSGLVTFDLVRGGSGTLQYSTAVWDRNLESSLTVVAERGSLRLGGQYLDKVEYCHLQDYQLPPLLTYVATLEAAAVLGLRPVPADVLPGTFNLDPAAAAAAITPRTGAIVAVHLFGQCADLEALRALCSQHGLALIEDNAQAIGATFRPSTGETWWAGTVGEVGTTSFFPSKNLGGFGDGGALFTRDAARAAYLRQLANHGQTRKYHHEHVGLNSRLDTLQAALLRVKLPHLPAWTAARQQVAARYDALLAGVPGLATPQRDPRSTHVYHQYTLTVPDAPGRRDALQQHLAAHGVPSVVYYPAPVHAQPAYEYLGYWAGQFPVAERLCRSVLSLPIHPTLSAEQVEYVAAVVRAGVGG